MVDHEEPQLLAYQPGVVTQDGMHVWIHIRAYDDASEVGWVRVRCKAHDCIQCEGARVSRLQRRLRRWALEGPSDLRYHLLTFSEANHVLLASALASLEWSWRRFTNYVRKVPNHPWKKVLRWARWTEVTKGRNGFNVHYHVIVGVEQRLNWKPMHTYWDLATGSRSNWNSSAAMDPEVAAAYAASYAKKAGRVFWGGLSQRDMTRYGRALKGRTRISWSRGSAPSIGPRESFYCCGQYDRKGQCGGEGSDPPIE